MSWRLRVRSIPQFTDAAAGLTEAGELDVDVGLDRPRASVPFRLQRHAALRASPAFGYLSGDNANDASGTPSA